MAEAKGIWLITESEIATDKGIEESGKGGSSRSDDPYPDPHESDRNQSEIKGGRTRIKAEDLEANMGEFLEVVEQAFKKAEEPKSRMRLEELELSVEINAEGQVGLLGNGTKAGAKGAMTLKFKRKDG